MSSLDERREGLKKKRGGTEGNPLVVVVREKGNGDRCNFLIMRS